MPGISNEDLMELIQRILQRVDTIEGKLDFIIENNLAKDKNESRFIFHPIDTDEELEEVSKNIITNKQYKQKLRTHILNKGILKLEHLFTGDFLTNCNSTGSYGKHKLDMLVPYNQIYAYLKMKTGQTPEEIMNETAAEVARIKHRLRMKHQRRAAKEAQGKGTKVQDKELDMEMIEEVLVHSVKLEENSKHEEVLIEVSVADEPTMEPESEVSDYEQEVLEQTTDDDEDDVDLDEAFQPINSERQLKKVSNRINIDPLYLKNLRLQIVEESHDGICTLQQLFTPEFLRENCTLNGFMTSKKLADLVPYKTVYYYLRKHLGQSLKEIEKEAATELKKLKHRLRMRESRKMAKKVVVS